MTWIGFLNESVRKKYDSVNLQPKTRNHSASDAARAVDLSEGYDAVNVWLARYFRDFPATRSPNILPEGKTAKRIVATTEMKNCTIPRIKAREPPGDELSAIAM